MEVCEIERPCGSCSSPLNDIVRADVEVGLVGWLVGALSQVNHKGLHQG